MNGRETVVVRTLIVDDEPLARRRLRAMLAREPDLEIVGEAGSGDAAVRAILDLRPDLVLLDIQMPGKDGFDVLEEISGQHQPIVENAVRHGIAPLEGGGSITLRATTEDGALCVTVTDDGVGVANSARTAGSGIGLGALGARLSFLYGAEHRLDIQPRTPRGTVVTLEIPYRTASP